MTIKRIVYFYIYKILIHIKKKVVFCNLKCLFLYFLLENKYLFFLINFYNQTVFVLFLIYKTRLCQKLHPAPLNRHCPMLVLIRCQHGEQSWACKKSELEPPVRGLWGFLRVIIIFLCKIE